MRGSIERNSSALFALSALTLIAASVAIMRTALFAKAPDIAAWGVTFDLTISLPLLYWFFIIRSGKAHAVTIAPVMIAGIVLASVLVPGAHQQFLRQWKWVAIPAAEVFAVAALARRWSRVRTVVASEVGMFYYALFCWRKEPAEVPGHPFTVHERSGWGTIVAGIILLIVGESIGMHLLLSMWSNTAAWIWTVCDVWAILWFVGDYHALRLKRSWIGTDALHVRYGTRWSVTVPLESIASVEEVREEREWKRRDVLKVSMLDEPRWLISFDQPVVAQGLAGFTKEIRGIALLPDDDETISVLQRAIGPRRQSDTHVAHR